jgi:hypothetical protein
MVGATFGPDFRNVRPAPRWSHCATERPRIGHVTWAAVQEQQDGVVAVLAADSDPLLDATQRDKTCFVDTLRGRDGELPDVAGAEQGSQLVELTVLRVDRPGCLRIRAALTERVAFPAKQHQQTSESQA